MKFIIFAILLTGSCILAFPQDKPAKNVGSWITVQENILKPLEVLKNAIQTYRQEKGTTF